MSETKGKQRRDSRGKDIPRWLMLLTCTYLAIVIITEGVKLNVNSVLDWVTVTVTIAFIAYWAIVLIKNFRESSVNINIIFVWLTAGYIIFSFVSAIISGIDQKSSIDWINWMIVTLAVGMAAGWGITLLKR